MSGYGMQVNRIFRKVQGGYLHWCEGCDDCHVLPYPNKGWTFDGNIDCPTFHPSFKHTGFRTVQVNGRWNGEWVRDEKGNPVPDCCHYIVVKGTLQYQNDCVHALKGKTVPIPLLPDWLQDSSTNK